MKCIEDEIPFDVPDGWEWTRLCSVSYDLPYGTSKKSSTNGKIAVLRMGNLQNGEIDYSDLVYSSDEEDIKKYYLIKGDLLFNRTNSIELVGKTSVYRGDIPAIYAGYLIRIRSSLNYEYLNAVMNSSYAREYCTSVRIDAVNQSNINATKLGHFLIAIPSKSEQKRISKKIAESIKVINIIEQEKLDLQAITANVKSKILDLAIRGKLVPQDPNDEPASVLLERIKAEKEELIKQGKIKRDKKESVIFKGEDNSYYEKIGNQVTCIDSEIPFEIPENWAWSRLSSFTEIVMGSSPKGEDICADSSFTEFHQGKIYFSKQYINCSMQYTKNISKLASKNSVLLCVRAPVGEVNITNRDICIGRGLSSILPLDDIDSIFLFYWLKTFKKEFTNQSTGSTFSAITSDIVKNILLPVPPLNEQNKITKTITYMFAYLEHIEASLN